MASNLSCGFAICLDFHELAFCTRPTLPLCGVFCYVSCDQRIFPRISQRNVTINAPGSGSGFLCFIAPVYSSRQVSYIRKTINKFIELIKIDEEHTAFSNIKSTISTASSHLVSTSSISCIFGAVRSDPLDALFSSRFTSAKTRALVSSRAALKSGFDERWKETSSAAMRPEVWTELMTEVKIVS